MEYSSLDKPTAGAFRFNTDSSSLEIYIDNEWTGVVSNPVTSNSARALFGAGADPGATNRVEFVQIMTTGNASDFGDLTSARHGGGGMSSATRAVFGGAWDGAATNTIDYVTIATTGNATDFGDATVAIYYSDCASDSHGGLG